MISDRLAELKKAAPGWGRLALAVMPQVSAPARASNKCGNLRLWDAAVAPPTPFSSWRPAASAMLLIGAFMQSLHTRALTHKFAHPQSAAQLAIKPNQLLVAKASAMASGARSTVSRNIASAFVERSAKQRTTGFRSAIRAECVFLGLSA